MTRPKNERHANRRLAEFCPVALSDFGYLTAREGAETTAKSQAQPAA